MNTDRRSLDFIEQRLQSLLERPSLWGAPCSVEDQVLQLLELRRFLLDGSLTARDTRKLMASYSAFVERSIPNATAEPLAVQLERRGRGNELSQHLRRFLDEEVSRMPSRARPPVPIRFPEPRQQP